MMPRNDLYGQNAMEIVMKTVSHKHTWHSIGILYLYCKHTVAILYPYSKLPHKYGTEQVFKLTKD